MPARLAEMTSPQYRIADPVHKEYYTGREFGRGARRKAIVALQESRRCEGVSALWVRVAVGLFFGPFDENQLLPLGSQGSSTKASQGAVKMDSPNSVGAALGFKGAFFGSVAAQWCWQAVV